MSGYFADLLAANRDYADRFELGGFDGIAHAGVAIVTCSTQEELRARVGDSAGVDVSGQHFAVVPDQIETLHADVATVRSHPLVAQSVRVGGFLYDVDTGLLGPVC